MAARHGGIYSTHIRDEGHGVFDAIEKPSTWGNGPVSVWICSTSKIAHQELWGRVADVFRVIERARAEGHDIRANVYPYRAGSNSLRSIVPPWAHDGGNDRMLDRLRDPALRTRMRAEILAGLPGRTGSSVNPALYRPRGR